MKKAWLQIYRGFATTLAAVGLLFFGLVFIGLYFHLELGPCGWAIALSSTLIVSGYYCGIKDGSMAHFLVGTFLAITFVVAASALMPDPVVTISRYELIARFLYTPLFAAAPATVGFVVGRRVRDKARRSSSAGARAKFPENIHVEPGTDQEHKPS